LKTTNRANFASKSLYGAVQSQRALHTPLGTTRSKNDAFQG